MRGSGALFSLEADTRIGRAPVATGLSLPMRCVMPREQYPDASQHPGYEQDCGCLHCHANPCTCCNHGVHNRTGWSRFLRILYRRGLSLSSGGAPLPLTMLSNDLVILD